MALPAYDAAKHHFGLGATGSEKGFMCSGYVKRSRAQQSQRVHQGSTNDFLASTSESTWTQDDFSGGQYQQEFKDAAMFSRGRGMFPSQLSPHPRASCGLIKGKTADTIGVTALVPAGTRPIACLQAVSAAFFVFPKRIIRAQLSSAGVVTTTVDTFNTTTVNFTCAYIEPTSYRLYVGCTDNKIRTFSISDVTAAPAVINNKDINNNDITGGMNWISRWGDILFANWNERLYQQTEDGRFQLVGAAKGSKSPTAGKIPGHVQDGCAYNGQLYMLVCKQGGLEATICATTGTQISTIAEVPYVIDAKCCRQYAGRLYIGGIAYDLDGNDGHGELFELTGNSLRLVRSWGREKARNYNFVPGIWQMDTVEGLLCFPNTTAKAIEIYDASQDAFFTGPAIDTNATLTTWDFPNVQPFAVLGYRDQMLVWMDSAAASERGIWRVRGTAGDTAPAHQGQSGHLETSDFGPEPGRKKRWGKLAVRTRNGWPGTVWCSIDAGANWNDLGARLPESSFAGELYTAIYDVGKTLKNVNPAYTTGYRIRFRIALWSTTMLTYAVEWNALTLHFAFVETNRHQWQLTIPGVVNVEAEDSDEGKVPPAVYTGTPEEVRSALWNWLDQGTTVTLKDRDGSSHEVHVADIVESEPQLNPKAGREMFFSVMLMEL